MKKSLPTENDDELFGLIHEKDKQAFSRIYDKYHRLIYVTALDYLKDSVLAEEVVQQTFLDLWENAAHLSIHVNLRNYLYTMAKNLILKTIRQKNKDVELAYELQIIQRTARSDLRDKLIAEKNYMELYKAINKLPEKSRKVCLMKLKSDMDNETISRQLGISVKTVKNNYSNALRFLKHYLKGKIAYLIICIIIGGLK